MGSTADYDGPYDVAAVEVDFAGDGRVYIGVKITAATTYYNDIPIAGVQIVSSGVLQQSWMFYNSAVGWETTTAPLGVVQSTVGFPITPLTAVSKSYSSIVEGEALDRFNKATSTGSSNTGSWGGTNVGAYSTTLAPVGNSTIASYANSYYLYVESSGSVRYTGVVMRSPNFSFIAGTPYEIRVIHAVTGKSADAMNPDDSLYIGLR
jgi:hypothetical protein